MFFFSSSFLLLLQFFVIFADVDAIIPRSWPYTKWTCNSQFATVSIHLKTNHFFFFCSQFSPMQRGKKILFFLAAKYERNILEDVLNYNAVDCVSRELFSLFFFLFCWIFFYICGLSYCLFIFIFFFLLFGRISFHSLNSLKSRITFRSYAFFSLLPFFFCVFFFFFFFARKYRKKNI